MEHHAVVAESGVELTVSRETQDAGTVIIFAVFAAYENLAVILDSQ